MGKPGQIPSYLEFGKGLEGIGCSPLVLLPISLWLVMGPELELRTGKGQVLMQ